jgi:hypothetical protein
MLLNITFLTMFPMLDGLDTRSLLNFDMSRL